MHWRGSDAFTVWFILTPQSRGDNRPDLFTAYNGKKGQGV
jgi:hypothetical protein